MIDDKSKKKCRQEHLPFLTSEKVTKCRLIEDSKEKVQKPFTGTVGIWYFNKNMHTNHNEHIIQQIKTMFLV